MVQDNLIFYHILSDSPLGRLRLAANPSSLCHVALGCETDESFYTWLQRKLRPTHLIQRRTPVIEKALAELVAYLEGDLRTFQTPLALHGTTFQNRVWTEVANIPYGQTVTYGEIATRIEHPHAARAVGQANGANPLPPWVPCHRVVGSGGALRGYGGGLELKAHLLALESACIVPAFGVQ